MLDVTAADGGVRSPLLKEAGDEGLHRLGLEPISQVPYTRLIDIERGRKAGGDGTAATEIISSEQPGQFLVEQPPHLG